MGDIRSICLLPEILCGDSPHSYTVFTANVDCDTDTDKHCGEPQEHHQRRSRCWRRRRRRCCSHRLNRISSMLLRPAEKTKGHRPDRPSTSKPSDDIHLAVKRHHRGIRALSRRTKHHKRGLLVASNFSASSMVPNLLAKLTGEQMASGRTATANPALAATDLLPASARSPARR
jgi:hypothetical protein